jgi:cell division septal protein FtsQ
MLGLTISLNILSKPETVKEIVFSRLCKRVVVLLFAWLSIVWGQHYTSGFEFVASAFIINSQTLLKRFVHFLG